MKTFKFSKATSLITVALLLAAAPLFGQGGFSQVGVTNSTGPALNTVLQYAVIPAASSIPVVLYVNASLLGADAVSNAASLVRFRFPTGQEIVPTATGVLGTNAMAVGSTNGLRTNDVYVFERKDGDTFQRLTPASFSAGLITFNETLLTPIATKDRLYKMELRGRLPGGTATVTASGVVFVGRAGQPAMVEAIGTATPVLNVVSGRYGPP